MGKYTFTFRKLSGGEGGLNGPHNNMEDRAKNRYFDNSRFLMLSFLEFYKRERRYVRGNKKRAEKQEADASPGLHWKVLIFSSNIQHLCLSAFVVVSRLG